MLIVIGRTAAEVISNSVKVYRGITFLYPDRIHGPGVRRFASQHEVRCRERGRVVPQQCDGEVCRQFGVDGRDIDAVRGHHEVVDDVAQRSCSAGIGEHLERKAVRAGAAWVSDGSDPVVHLQAWHLGKLAGVIGDQRGLLA